jgi:hypothetical protein
MKNYILPLPRKLVYALGGQLGGRFLGLFDEGGSLPKYQAKGSVNVSDVGNFVSNTAHATHAAEAGAHVLKNTLPWVGRVSPVLSKIAWPLAVADGVYQFSKLANNAFNTADKEIQTNFENKNNTQWQNDQVIGDLTKRITTGNQFPEATNYDHGGEHTAEKQFIMNGKEDAYRTHFKPPSLNSIDPRMLPYGVSNVGTNTNAYTESINNGNGEESFSDAFNRNASFSNAAGADKFMVERPWLNNLFNKGNVRIADIDNRFDMRKINEQYGSLENLLATGEYQLGQNGEIVNTPNVASLFDSSITNGNEETYNGGYGQFFSPNEANNNQGSFNTSISNNNNETTSTSAEDYWEQFGKHYNSDSDPYLYSNPDSIRMLNETGFYGSPAENQYKRYGGDLLKAQDGSESFYPEEDNNEPEHLNEIDITDINADNYEKINSQAYRDRLKIEYLNAHNINLSETEIDDIVKQLNLQLKQGAGEGNTAFYTDFGPDEYTLGYMINGPSQISADGSVLNPNESGYDQTSKSAGTTGNIYIGTNAPQLNPYATYIDPTTGKTIGAVSSQNSIEHHEVNHRLNALKGSPLTSAKYNPDGTPNELYNESTDYHNSFLQIGPEETNVYHPNYVDQEFHDYATSPYEIKSQKAQLEQALMESGIWDPSTGPFTQEHIDKMIEMNLQFSDGTDYLAIALGLDQLIEGTIDNPGYLENPIATTGYNEFIQDEFNHFLGSRGKVNLGNDELYGSDWRNLSTQGFESLDRRIQNFQQGSKKWQEWSKKHQTLNAQNWEAGSIVDGLEDFINEGTSGTETVNNLLESLGLKKDNDGDYITTPEDDKRIQDLLNEWKLKATEIGDKYDESEKNRPKEDGFFGSHGPLKNWKYNRLVKDSIKSFNEIYKTDFKTWDDIKNSINSDEYSDEDIHMRNAITKDQSTFSSLMQDFDQEKRELIKLEKTVEKGEDKDYQIQDRYLHNSNFNIALANDYMEYANITEEQKEDNYLDNTYKPNEEFGYDVGNYFDGIDKINFDKNNKTALDNDIWYKDLYTQAVLSLPDSGRDAFIEYYNQDSNKKFKTKKEIRHQRSLIKNMQHYMHDVRRFIEEKQKSHSEFIKQGNQQYELDKEQQLINDNQKNKELQDRIGPNFLDFMNNVAMGDDESESDNIDVRNARYGGALPKFHDAGEVHEHEEENKILKTNQTIDQWNQQYVQSNNFSDMLRRSGDEASDIQHRIDAVMKFNPDTDITYDINNPNLGQMYNDASFDSSGRRINTGSNFHMGTNKINYNPFRKEGHFLSDPTLGGSNWDGVSSHEQGHLIGEYGLNKKTTKALKSIAKENDQYIKHFANKNKDVYNHAKDPEEMRANLLQLRFQLENSGFYKSTEGDVNKRPFTMNDLKDIMIIDENGEFNGYKPGYNNELLETIHPDDVVWMMNNVAQAPIEDDLSGRVINARYGGQLQYILNKQYGI